MMNRGFGADDGFEQQHIHAGSKPRRPGRFNGAERTAGSDRNRGPRSGLTVKTLARNRLPVRYTAEVQINSRLSPNGLSR